MATKIKTWEIVSGQLREIDTTLSEHGRTEAQDLETWIATDPSILREGLRIIGRQVMTRGGPLDLLAIDHAGDLYVVELKRDKLSRDALAQAIDYASDIRSWPVERISEVCASYTNLSLEEVFAESFPDVDLESITINEAQRILLVGFASDSALERMIEWLSDQYGVWINAVVLKYIHTSTGTEVLARTAVLSEEIEAQRARKKRIAASTSDEPGKYERDELERYLRAYLQRDSVTARRMREVFFPACLAGGVVTRERLKQELLGRHLVDDAKKAGFALSNISNQVGTIKNDFLRQVVKYEYPVRDFEKDNYQIVEEYRDLVSKVLLQSGT